MNCSNWDYRISLTEAGLAMGALASFELPSPNNAPYNDSTIETGRSHGGQALHGFANLPMLWDRVTMSQAARLRKFIDNAKSGTGLLYMTIAINDASYNGFHWVDVSGRPHRMREAADSGDIAMRSGSGLQFIDNYLVLLNNILIINDPSLYTVI